MKDDPEFNIKFVALVEEHPCLYDHHQSDYCNRTKQDIAWESISQEVKGTASECKERWKNLRACYTRHLKNKPPSGSGAKVKRPYYLSEYMQFLEPFTKSRKQTGNISVLSNISTTSEIEQLEHVGNGSENDFDNTDVPRDVLLPNEKEFSDDDELTSNVEFNQQRPNCAKKSILKKKQRPIQLDDVNKAAFDYFNKKKKIVPEEDDTDLCFLKSLLPDIKLMNDEQKRRYKIQMISVAGSILSEPKMPSNQQKSDLYYYGNTRPNSTSSAMSSTSIASSNIQFQQRTTNSNSVIASNLSTLIQPQSNNSADNEVNDDIIYTQQWYS